VTRALELAFALPAEPSGPGQLLAAQAALHDGSLEPVVGEGERNSSAVRIDVDRMNGVAR
jgi:hypothetical protein